MQEKTNFSGCMFVFLLGASLSAVLSFLLQCFWNWIAPGIGMPLISYWQAILIYFLIGLVCTLVFKKNVERT